MTALYKEREFGDRKTRKEKEKVKVKEVMKENEAI